MSGKSLEAFLNDVEYRSPEIETLIDVEIETLIEIEIETEIEIEIEIETEIETDLKYTNIEYDGRTGSGFQVGRWILPPKPWQSTSLLTSLDLLASSLRRGHADIPKGIHLYPGRSKMGGRRIGKEHSTRVLSGRRWGPPNWQRTIPRGQKTHIHIIIYIYVYTHIYIYIYIYIHIIYTYKYYITNIWGPPNWQKTIPRENLMKVGRPVPARGCQHMLTCVVTARKRPQSDRASDSLSHPAAVLLLLLLITIIIFYNNNIKKIITIVPPSGQESPTPTLPDHRGR